MQKLALKQLSSALSQIDLHGEVHKLEEEYAKIASVASRHKLMRRIKVFTSLIQGNLRPEWMVFSILPVLTT